MKVIQIIIFFTLMLAGLFSCENFDIKKKPHTWGGSISFIFSNLSSVAHASDGICLSTCTSTKCANLIVHTDSSTHETVCSTNATTSYEFKFKENPNEFYEGKLVEIQIVDSLDDSNNRSKIEVVGSDTGKVKNIDLGGSIVASVIKEKLLLDLDEDVADIKTVYESYKRLISIESIDAALVLLSGSGLLADLNDAQSVASAITVIENLEPNFLVGMIEKVKESSDETEVYTSLQNLCGAKGTKLLETTETLVGEPYCYLSLASIASGSLVAWDPGSEAPEGCNAVYETYSYDCSPIHAPSFTFAEEPSDLASFIRASDYLEQNYTNNRCYIGGMRFGAYILQDYNIRSIDGTPFDPRSSTPPLQLSEDGPPTYSAIDLTHNTYMVAKTYSACLADPAYRPFCSVLTTDPNISSVLSAMAQEDFCYF